MTDRELADHYAAVLAIDRAARATDGEERAQAQAVVRQAGALKQALEQWIVTRHTRAQAAVAVGGVNGG